MNAQAVVLFAYDWGAQSLVFAHPDNGQPVRISTARLRELGWTATDEGFRSSLPRIDKPMVQVAPAMNRAMRRATRQ